MKQKLLRPKDKILLTLAFLGDIFDEVRLVGGLVPHNFQVLYGWTPPAYKRNNFTKTLARVLKTGEIAKDIKNGEVCFCLTNEGKEKISREFPSLWLQRRKWDGLWTLVSFDIAQIRKWLREWLRGYLYDLGFGKLHWSVYISPHPIADDLVEVFTAKGLMGNIRVFRSKHIGTESDEELALKVWPLKKINQDYREILEDWEKLKLVSLEKRNSELRCLRTRFLSILSKDPCLPFDLLPGGWLGRKVSQEIRHLPSK